MSTLTITIEPKAAAHWPVVAEWLRPGDVGRITRNGRLALDLNTLRIRATPRAYGVDLGNALFTGAVRDTFLAARAAGVVHVRLDVRAADLQALHWQRLCAPGDGDDWDFLRLNQRTPYARLLPRVSDRQFRPLAAGDLWALVVVARPDDLLANGLDEFDAEATVAGLRRALGSIPHDVLGPVAGAIGPATLDALCEQLTATHYTLLHIVCHGHYESETGDTFMYLCGPQNTTVAVSATDLLARLATLGALPHAVFLATCDTARPTAGDAMLNLAERLVRESRLGVPFVVAMAERVSIETAEALASKYYERLRAHGEPDVALTEACAGVQARYDVMVPMLFTAADGSALFAEEPALPAAGPGQSLHQLPADPPHFTGRGADVDAVCAMVRGGAGAAITVIHGAGGVGKTALATIVANRVLVDFPDAQIVLDLRGTAADPAPPAELLARVIRAFRGSDARLPDVLADLVAMYHSCLAGKRALIVADNAGDAEQVQALVPPDGSALLVTTRKRFYIGGMQTRELDALNPGEAQELLLAHNAALAADAAAVASACGRLPLALTLAARWTLENPMLGAHEWLRRSADSAARLRLTGADTALSVSLAILPEDTQRAWCALSVFPAEFRAESAQAVWDFKDDPERTRGMDMLATLWRYSLLEYNAVSERYHLHDLARAFADAQLPSAERELAALRHARHFANILIEAQRLYDDGGNNILQGLALFDREFANIAAGQSWSAARASTDSIAAAVADDYASAANDIKSLRLHPSQYIAWLEAGLAAARRLNRRLDEGTHLENLGSALDDLGEYRRVIECCEQRLALARELGDRRGIARALGGLGNAYLKLGNARKAIEYCEQALEIHREIGDLRGEGVALSVLGNAYFAVGNDQQAIAYHIMALNVAVDIGDRRGVGTSLGNLGNAHLRLGDASAAIHFYEQRLSIARELGDRLGEGTGLGNLGNAYLRLGDVPKAIAQYEQQLVIVQAIGDRAGEGRARGSLGLAHANQRDFPKAIDDYEQALLIHREIGDRRGEGADLYNLADAHDELGDRVHAIDLMRESLRIHIEIEDPFVDNVRAILREWGVETENQ